MRPGLPCVVVAIALECAIACGSLGCGDDVVAADSGATDDAPMDDAGPRIVERQLMPSAPPIAPATECRVTLTDEIVPIHGHVPDCSAMTYPDSPPLSGMHYGTWAAFATKYSMPVPWGFLVHDMEHGAVVLLHNCPSGCPEVLAEYDRLLAEFGPDPVCTASIRNRIIIMPDPSLDVPVAATAWGHSYRATCFDRASLDAFVSASYALGPENQCAQGADLSLIGWCSM